MLLATGRPGKMNFLNNFLAGEAVKELGRRSLVFNIRMLNCKPSGNHHFSSSEELSGFIHPVAFPPPLSLSFLPPVLDEGLQGNSAAVSQRASERGN